MIKYAVFAFALLLGCLLIPAVEPVKAGSGCHGKKTAPTSVVVEQDVVVQPGVTVKETVEVDGNNVTVTDEVDINEAGGPVGVHATKKAARKAKRATIAEAKAERKAARAAKKEANAEFEAGAEAAVKNAYSN